MTTNENPARGGRPKSEADRLDQTAAGTAETDIASGIDDAREPDSLDGYGVRDGRISDGASRAEDGAYGAENDAARNDGDGGSGNEQLDSSLADRLRTPGSPV